ncbi:hypothetical protein ACGFX4_24910 [Kitasatospora sp. NPDC048365]|uniref:Uncharacterized protein n=1 Tax=Kitasatospora terrestris TaxID=258051 RepID=A0ABP9EI79_9ACTN
MRYEIRVSGVLREETRREGFPELESVTVPGQTMLFGDVVDEAHLYGLLRRFQVLGLTVTELRRLPE